MRHPHHVRRLFLQLAVAAALVAAAGSAPALRGGASAEPASPPVRSAKVGTSASPASAPADDAQVATFSGGAITVADWRTAYQQRLPQEQAVLASPEGRLHLLRDLERYALLVQEAQRRGYEHHVVVEAAGKKAAIDTVTAHELAIDPTTIADADVAAEYVAKGAQYHRPALRRASEIVVPTEEDARRLLQELRGATRDQFGKVARERSIDERTRKQSGELGWFARTGLGPDGRSVGVEQELVAATWSLPKRNALTPRPLRVEKGFAILQLTGEDVAIDQTLKDASGEIREQLAARRGLQQVEELVARLRATTPVELHPERLDAIVLSSKPELDIPQGFPPYPADPRDGPRRIKPDKY
jgi:hypothetical protein